MRPADRNAALHSLRDEHASAYLYAALAEREAGKASDLFRKLETASARQAALWEKRLAEDGVPAPPFAPRLRERLVAAMVRRLGPRRMLPVLSAMKVRGLSIYRGDPRAAEMPAEFVANLVTDPKERWHRTGRGGGALRAAVFGVNDGIVSNAGLILGVAGADPDATVVALAGVAGMLAGGFSMAAGEYVSVRTQREMLERQIALERQELRYMPEEEVEELALIYQARGLPFPAARDLASRLVADPEQGLKTLAREELGLDPDSLASPGAAAAASFLSFAAGACLPLLPYLLASGGRALLGTVVVTLASLLSVGAAMSLFTGKPAWYSALRMAGIGALAGALTHGIGRLFGVTLG
jgi:VIT1/CCC1 family predicted Fe2+/Mn2+ transporter